mmetsp:Transcript_10377/g.28906  ORF Transcript_10377/g.28906 Transcript_10377/m.28906 type:complete len:237 (+) Transcript_10377:1918-2628(+)
MSRKKETAVNGRLSKARAKTQVSQSKFPLQLETDGAVGTVLRRCPSQGVDGRPVRIDARFGHATTQTTSHVFTLVSIQLQLHVLVLVMSHGRMARRLKLQRLQLQKRVVARETVGIALSHAPEGLMQGVRLPEDEVRNDHRSGAAVPVGAKNQGLLTVTSPNKDVHPSPEVPPLSPVGWIGRDRDAYVLDLLASPLGLRLLRWREGHHALDFFRPHELLVVRRNLVPNKNVLGHLK